MHSVYLKTERLMFEPLKEQHADFLFDGLSDAALYKYIPQEPPADNEHLKERFMRLAMGTAPYGNEQWLNWAVKEKFGEDYVGLIEATINSDQVAHLAYFIFQKYWQCGYGTEACTRAVEQLFGEYRCRVIRAEVDSRNVGSIKLLRKVGFREVDFIRDADVFKGSSSDEYIFELNR